MAELIAIVGIGCRFPGGADTPETFWSLLRDGVDAVGPVPSWRWDAAKFYDSDRNAPGKMYVREGGFLTGDDITKFDSRFFRMSPREAESVDPQQRLLLEVAWEALENAGQSATRLEGSRTGVFVGSFWDDYSAERFYRIPLTGIDAFNTIAGVRSMAAGRIAHALNLQGPSVYVDTACSASLLAVHLAGASLRNGECDLALAGGVSLILSPRLLIGNSRMNAIASTGRCKSFAGGTDGFGRGEGCGVVVLKRYANAVRDGDTILACIRGSAVNHCGRSLSLTTPNIASQRAVIQSALSNAGVEPGHIQYLEAHGAGTPLGDPIEMAAIGEVFGPVRETPLLVGSVKTNIAHLDPAAGVSGLIKVALAMQHGAIPGNLHFDPPNPMIRWSRLPVKVPVALTPWDDSPKLAGVSSFGLSGTNVHVVLEEAARKEKPVSELERSHWILPLSAISEEALGALALKYQSHLADSSPSLADISYTAAVGRSHFEHRVALVSGSVTQLREQISALVVGERVDGIVRLRRGQERRKPRIAFLFTGQGAQYINMGRQLYATHPLFRRIIDQCDRILRPWLERPLLSVLYPDGPDDGVLSRTSYAQPALFAIEYALAELWRSWGIEPDAVLGHSTGELIAACVAGVYSLEDGVKFVAERARLIESVSGSSATAAALAGVERVQSVVDSIPGVDVAGINSPLETLIAGHAMAVEQAIGILTAEGVECRRLPITHAPHSPLMDPILDEFEAVARQIDYRTPKCMYVSNVTGEAVDAIDAHYWRRHLREPVRFTAGMARLAAEGCNVLLEAGPQPILQLLGRQSWRGPKGVAWLSSLWSVQDDWAQLLSSAAELYVRGANLDWLRFEREAGSVGVRRKVVLPTYPFQRERCWTVVKESLAAEDATWHPLLGSPLSSALLKPGELLFESTLSAQEPQYLDGHRAFDLVLLPGSAYVEMALAFAAREPGATLSVVENVVFERALPLPADGAPTKVQVLAAPSRSGHRWEVYSAAATNTAWTRHASGTVRTSTDTPLLTIEAEPGEPVDPAVLYANFERNNLHYGPDFRLIRRLWRSETAIRAEVQLTPHLTRDAARYQLHPALLDACMHASALLFLKDGPSASVFLPVAFDKIVFRRTGKPITELICDARLRSISPLVIDLALSTRSGDTVASIEGMQVKETDALVLADHELWRDWMYRLAWEPQEAAPAGSRAGSHWLILSDSREFAEPLASALQSTGAEVTLADTLPQPLPAITGIVHAFSKAVASTSCDRLLSLVQTLGVSGKLPPLWIVTKGAVAAGPRHGLDGLSQSPLWGLARVIGLEYSPAQPVCVDLDPSASLQENAAKLAADLSAAPPEDQVAYRNGMRYVARLTRLQAAQAEQRRVPGSGEIEIELTAAGLNFRDVLMSLNLYPGPPAPMGLEGAGRVAAIGPNAGDFKIGDRVMVIQPGCFQSHLTVDHRLAVGIPDRLTDIEAATIPSAFVTAWHCLSHLARIKPGDRVLIHTGAGGIGQAAIRIAQLAGAEIFSTASPSKWPALRSLGVEHICNSRTTDFGHEILAATEGRGVNVILNTLTGPGFVEQSLAALAPGGCFLEISKRDVWSAARMASARPDVSYHLVDQAEILVKAPDLVQAQLRTLADLFEQRKLEPMERTVFEMRDRASAFRMMETARHTGKIVLVHESRRAVSIDPEATYLITGGAGGLGLVTARGLVEQGARRLILVSRRLPGAAAETAIAGLRAMGANVIAEAADVSDFERLESLIGGIPKEHPLKGVIHAAGFLDDGLLVNQSPERFARVMAPKIDGAWHLHRLTADLALDFFVMFSSASSLLGHVGQANYAAANAFLDSLAHYRHSLGLPALAINWGVWADVGSAAQFTSQLAALGFDAIQPKQGPAIIDHLLGVPDAQVGVIGLNWSRFDARRPFFTHVRQESRQPWRSESEEDLPALNDAPALTAYIRRQVASILRYATPESVPTRQGFRELGMDSLTSMELRNRLQNALDRELPPAVIFNHPTVEALAHFLTGRGETLVQEAPAAQAQGGSEMRERMLSVNGLDLCLCEWGALEGRLALLIHGTRDHAASWDPIAQALAAEGYRVVAPDLRGHGRSGHCALSSRYHLGDFVSDLVQIVERLGEQPTLVAGHSLGAIIAVLYASANPKGAKRLVLVEPPLSPIADDSQSFIEQLTAYSRAAAEVRGHSTMPDLQAAADRLRQVTPGMPPEVAMSRAQRLTQPSSGGLAWRWDARFDGPGNVDTLFAGLRKGEYLRMMVGLEPPVTIVYGDSSGWISRDERVLMAAALPGARVTVLPGGHNVHLDSPAALSLAILQKH